MAEPTQIEFEYSYRWYSQIDLEGDRGTTLEDNLDSQTRPLLNSIKQLADQYGATTTERSHRSIKDHRILSVDMGIGADMWLTLTIVCGSIGTAIPFLKVIQPIVIQWLKTESAKSIKIKHGSTEITIKGTDDVERALQALKQFVPEPRSKVRKK